MPNVEDRRSTFLCELVQMSQDGRIIIVRCTLKRDDPDNDQNCLLKCKIPLWEDHFVISPTIEGDDINGNSGRGSDWQYDERLHQLQSVFTLRSQHSLRGREFKTRFFAGSLLDIQSTHVIFQESAANESIAGTTKVSIQL